MKYAYALAAVAAVVHAQTRADIPKCALPCLDKAIPSTTDCKVDDYPCVCKDENFTKVQAGALTCVTENCDDLGAVVSAAKKLCDAQGSAPSGKPSGKPSNTEPASTAAETSAEETTPAATETSAVETSMATQPTTSAAAPPATNGTQPTDAPKPTDAPQPGAAAAVGSVGAIAMLALGALAL